MNARSIAGAIALAAVLGGSPIVHAGQQVEDFSLPSARDNELVRLSDYDGKVVLINFCRTACGYWQKEHPTLAELQKNYGPKGLVILGVADEFRDTVDKLPGYLADHGITWPVGLNDRGEFTQVAKPRPAGTPTNYLVSRSGTLTRLGLGRSDEDWQELEEAVTRALAEPGPQGPAVRRRELEEAPALALTDLDGKTHRLENYAGKPLVVNFFFSGTADWTGALLAKLHEEYAERGLRVIGINLFDDDAAIRQYIDKYKVSYPVLHGDAATQQAWIGSSAGWATFFVTPDGKILKQISQFSPRGIHETVFRKYADYLVRQSSEPDPKELRRPDRP